MASSALNLERSRLQIPITFIVGLILIGIALAGVIYSFIPANRKVSEIDLGSVLQTLPLPAQVYARPSTADENPKLDYLPGTGATATLINWVPQSTPTRSQLRPRQCDVSDLPSTFEEGITELTLTYKCNGEKVDAANVQSVWTNTAGRLEQTGPLSLKIDTSGLVGKRITLTASISGGCGPTPCQLSFTAVVVPRRYKITVRIDDIEVKPIAGSTVTLTDPSGQKTTKDASSGQVEFAGLLPGRYHILATAPGYTTFDNYREVSTRDVRVRAALFPGNPDSSSERLGSPSPSPSPSPTPSPSPSPTPSASPSVSPSVSASPVPSAASPVAPPERRTVDEPVFAPGRNGKLSISWPDPVFAGWPDTCEVRYEPPPGWSLPSGYDVQAAFVLTSPKGLADESLTSSYQPLDGKAHRWTIPLKPIGEDGSLVTAQLVMLVQLRREDSTNELPIQPLQSTIVDAPLTRNQTLGGSGFSAVLGAGFLAVGRRKRGRVRQSEEAARYTDVTIYEGHLYPSDSLAEATTVPDNAPLIANNLYTLEVAIRLKRTGIASDLPAEREVENPRRDQETLTIYVTATPLRGFIIPDGLATIKWPYNEDSESALFRLEIDPKFDSARPGAIEICILDDSLNLLDIVTLEVPLADEFDTDLRTPSSQLIWKDKDSEGLTLAGTSKPRLATIRVRPATGGFTFEYIFKSAGGKPVRILVFRNISTDDLNNLLAGIRDFWTRLVIKTYSRKLTASQLTYDTYLKELRDLGMRAWALLFNTRTADQKGASEHVGQILAAADEQRFLDVRSLLDTANDKTIQISYDAHYGDFIFPWNILHPPMPKDEPVDPLRFWGARYRIEQVTGGPKEDQIDERPTNILFALDPSFGDAPSQKKMFEDYQNANKGVLEVSAPISDRKTLENYLLRDPAVHLLYFYCHGYAATRPGVLMADGVQSLKRYIEEIRNETSADSTTAAALEKLMELTSKMAGESWIYLGDSEVKEADLGMLDFFAKPRRPIVFLNMCQSADLIPSMSSGLVHLFLNKNASAIIGTESPMTGVFADAFARRVLDALFSGESIGTALWKARRYFLTEKRNPLGLAYTLYGRADANLGNQPFIVPNTVTTSGESSTQTQ